MCAVFGGVFLAKVMHLNYVTANRYFECAYTIVCRVRAIGRLHFCINSFRSFNERPGK